MSGQLRLSDSIEAAYREARSVNAPLSERLQYVADAVTRLVPEFQAKVDEFVDRLAEAETGQNAPAIGAPMPGFLLPDDRGGLASLDDFLGKGPLAIVFHRGHWCPYCRLSTAALEEARATLKTYDGNIISITPETQRYASVMKQDTGASFPILADYDNGYALSLGLAIWVEAGMAEMINAAGWTVPVFQGNDSWMLPIPAAFVINSDGLVVARHIDPDYRRRMPIEDILDAMKSSA